MLHSEGLVGLIEIRNNPRVIALDPTATELLDRRHGVAEDRVQSNITPQSTMVGMLPLDAIMERCIATGRDLDRPSNKDAIDGAAAGDMGAGSIGTMGCKDGISHLGSLEKFRDGTCPDVLIAVHHQDNVVPLDLPLENHLSQVVQHGLTRLQVRLADLVEVIPLLSVDSEGAGCAFGIGVVGRDDSKRVVILAAKKLPDPSPEASLILAALLKPECGVAPAYLCGATVLSNGALQSWVVFVVSELGPNFPRVPPLFDPLQEL